MRDAIDMAREAGFRVGPSRDGPDEVRGAGLNLKWFEALARADEREACAKLIEAKAGMNPDWQKHLAAAIRARGNT
jgi:hypothetical protein